MSVAAQLNFSTGWGKRGEELQIKTDGTHSGGVQLSVKQLTHMYRLLKVCLGNYLNALSDFLQFTQVY